MNNNVRHSVGDKVVALVSSPNCFLYQPLIKGKIYIVEDVLYCSACGSQKVNFGYYIDKTKVSNQLECTCGNGINNNNKHWSNSNKLSPLSETSLQHAVKEENYELAAIIRDALKTEKV